MEIMSIFKLVCYQNKVIIKIRFKYVWSREFALDYVSVKYIIQAKPSTCP